VTVTVVLTFWAPLAALRVMVPEHLAPNLTVVVTLPLAFVVPEEGLKVTMQPAPPPVAEYVTAWSTPPRKWAVQVTEPPTATVVGMHEALVPGVPL
jgi:hypothetical protein